MAKTKKTHPADQADRDAVSTATKFNVHLRRSTTSKVNKAAATLAEAVVAFDELRSVDENRRPIIYAITPRGQAVPVPADMIAAARAPMFDDSQTIEEALAPLNPGDGLIGITEAEAVEMADDEIPAFLLREGFGSQEKAEAPAKVKRDRKPKAEKPAKEADAAPKAAKALGGKRGEILAAAQAGTLPTPPDFSAETHFRYRKKLAAIVALVEGANIEALKAVHINPISSSPKAMDRYRSLAVIALEARLVPIEAA